MEAYFRLTPGLPARTTLCSNRRRSWRRMNGTYTWTAPSRSAARTRSPSLVFEKREYSFWSILSRKSWHGWSSFCVASMRASVTGCSFSGSL